MGGVIDMPSRQIIFCLYPKSKQKLIEKVAKPGDIDGCLFVDVALNVGLAHIWGVLEILREATVLKHDWVEDILDHLIGVLVASVDATVLVIKLDGTGYGLEKYWVECKRSSDWSRSNKA